MASIFALLGGLWFAGCALFNVSGGDEAWSFPRVIYVGLALIAFALVDYEALIGSRGEDLPITLAGREPERPSDD